MSNGKNLYDKLFTPARVASSEESAAPPNASDPIFEIAGRLRVERGVLSLGGSFRAACRTPARALRELIKRIFGM